MSITKADKIKIAANYITEMFGHLFNGERHTIEMSLIDGFDTPLSDAQMRSCIRANADAISDLVGYRVFIIGASYTKSGRGAFGHRGGGHAGGQTPSIVGFAPLA